MKSLGSYLDSLRKIVQGKTLHILTLGFEERCIAYLNFLSNNSLIKNQNRFICVSPTDHNVSNYLTLRRKEYRKYIQNTLPNISIAPIEQILQEINSGQTFENFCIDISTTPRIFIFKLLHSITEKKNSRIFIIYSYPKRYMFGNLEEASPIINYIFDTPQASDMNPGRILIMPGFDLNQTTVSLSHLYSHNREWKTHWLIPFPGRKYHFYERTLERHLPLIGKDTPRLFPMDELKYGADVLFKEILQEKDISTFVIPLGPRIISVPVFLAATQINKKNDSDISRVNIIFPKTIIHNSLRSDGSVEPLIEEITSKIIV